MYNIIGGFMWEQDQRYPRDTRGIDSGREEKLVEACSRHGLSLTGNYIYDTQSAT